MGKKKKLLKPLGRMVLIVYDGDKSKTSGGILLPDKCKIETLTGRIIAMPEKMKDDELEYPFREYDHVVYDTRYSIPVDLEPGNKHYLIDYQYLYAVVPEDEEEANTNTREEHVER